MRNLTDEEFDKLIEERQQLYEMARVGNFGEYRIYVYSGERNIAHFHFINRHTGAEGCIKILTNEYYQHGGHNATLNSRERKELVKFLKATSKQGSAWTNYQAICFAWNICNDNYMLPGDSSKIKMPDYENMKVSESYDSESRFNARIPEGWL